MFLPSIPAAKRPRAILWGRDRGPWLKFGHTLPSVGKPPLSHKHAPPAAVHQEGFGEQEPHRCPPPPQVGISAIDPKLSQGV